MRCARFGARRRRCLVTALAFHPRLGGVCLLVPAHRQVLVARKAPLLGPAGPRIDGNEASQPPTAHPTCRKAESVVLTQLQKESRAPRTQESIGGIHEALGPAPWRLRLDEPLPNVPSSAAAMAQHQAKK